jgi:hypothetical protein
MSEPAAPDKRVVACNYHEGTKHVAPGALAFVLFENRGNGAEKVELLVRSRGGRFIRKWESLWRLKNLRVKTLPPSHPLYTRFWWTPSEEDAQARLAYLTACHDRELRIREAREARRMIAAAEQKSAAEDISSGGARARWSL